MIQSPTAPRSRLSTLALESKSPPIFYICWGGRERERERASNHHFLRPLDLHRQSSRSNALRRQYGRPAEYWRCERKQLQRFCKLLRLSTSLQLVTCSLLSRCESFTSMPALVHDPFSHEQNTNDTIRMLEDPSYSQVVRWGDDGGSFVVLEVRANEQHPSIALADSLRRMRDSPSLSFPNISSIATSPASCASSTSMTSTRCDTTMKRVDILHTARA